MNPSSRKRSSSNAPQLEDVPELIHNIQSRLPVKTAACTSLLSKSWLHAWRTIPTLRFCHRHRIPQQRNPLTLVDMDRTLMRYLHDHIPIERFHLAIEAENQESASLAEKWIRLLATKTCVKEFSLTGLRYVASFNMPVEILSSEHLTKISIAAYIKMTTTHPHLIINCLSLTELNLNLVHISQEILDGILSSCRLLAKVKLLRCSRDLKTIKVKNLPCLSELSVETDDGDSTNVVISHLPNLRVFRCDIILWSLHLARPFNAHSISLGSNVTQLTLGGLIITEYASLDMLKSGFPFLESLTLLMTTWTLTSFHFTSLSIKSLCLHFWEESPLTDVQVHAPKLLFFWLAGYGLMPSLSFPLSNLKQISLTLNIFSNIHIDASFFLKMREAFTLSCKFKFCIHIETYHSTSPLDIDIDDLRTRLTLPPATNVRRLSFTTGGDECLWDHSPFFDAFFEISHPKYVFATSDRSFKHHNHFCRLMVKEVLEKKKNTTHWSHYLERVQIKQPSDNRWKTLTDSHRSFLDGSAPEVCTDFKLKWR